MQKNKLNTKILSRVLALAKPYRLTFLTAALLAVLLAPLSTLRPYLIKVLVDDYIFPGDLNGMTTLTIALFGILLLEVSFRYIFIYSTNWLGQMVVRDLRTRIFNHLTELKLSFFDKTPIGTVTTRTINDIETINTVFSQGVITIIADILTLVAVLTIMFVTSWKLTLVCLIVFPFLIVASYIFKEKVKASYQIVRTQIARMNAFLQERISGMKTLQIFNAEKQEMEKFKLINREYTQANLNSILDYAVFFPVVEIISAAALGLMVWFGAQNALHGEVSLGALIAFPLFLSMLFRPVRMLADKFNTLQMGLVAAERVFAALDNNSKIENKGTIQVQKLKGNVAFKNVFFAYNYPDFILKDLSFEVKPGETLAIVGSTGSGKTTIINLLNRFYDIQKGNILIDGQDIRDFELFHYRRKIAIVLQDVFLFSGSVLENITLRDDTISRQTVIDAAKLIGAHHFIQQLPGAYDYQVRERGATLSMGQRQLISFVRALVFQPDLLILDEATSSIDPESEAVIQYAIEKLIEKRTSFIIAHRLSTIRHANNILVLHKGKLVEFGPHEKLLTLESGHYRKLYEMQFLENTPA